MVQRLGSEPGSPEEAAGSSPRKAARSVGHENDAGGRERAETPCGMLLNCIWTSEGPIFLESHLLVGCHLALSSSHFLWLSPPSLGAQFSGMGAQPPFSEFA
jgi:hypothetical protein